MSCGIRSGSPDNEAIRELRDKMKEVALKTEKSNREMKWLTWIIIVLTAIMVVIGIMSFKK